jgi:hypothetical protein
MSVHFILYGKDKIQMVGNPNPYTHTLSKPWIQTISLHYVNLALTEYWLLYL